ncbi:hypothetical protein D3C81_2002690 [compost metagenome]
MAVITGQHQQGVTLVIAQVGRQTAGKQAPEHVGIALAGTLEDLLGKGRCFVIGHGGGRGLGGHVEPPGRNDCLIFCQASTAGQRFRFYRADS